MDTTWDGKDDGGNFVRDGWYTFLLNANTSNLTAQQRRAQVLVDKGKPKVTLAAPPVSPTRFNPSLVRPTLSYSLSEASTVKIDVVDAGNTTVRSYTNLARPFGPNTETSLWDGKNTGGTLVADGIYTFKIQATDRASNLSDPLTSPPTVTLDTLAPSAPSVDAPASPTNATSVVITGQLLLASEVNGGATVNIYYDPTHTSTKGPLLASRSLGNGITRFNVPVDLAAAGALNTLVHLLVTVTDVAGNESAAASVPNITQDTIIPVITSAGASPNPFAPGHTLGTTAVSYQLSEAATVLVRVLNASDGVVATLVPSLPQSGGIQTTTWDGSGQLSGVYTAAIDAWDASGNHAVQVRVPITIEVAPPGLSGVSVSPAAFGPTASTLHPTTTISSTVGQPATVLIRVYQGSTLIRTLVSEARQPGSYQDVWDGFNDNNPPTAAEGSYTFTVDATDSLGNAAPTVSGTVRVDLSPPPAPAFVNDGLGPDAITTQSTSVLSASWPASIDPDLAGYQVAIGTTPGATDTHAWLDVGNVLGMT